MSLFTRLVILFVRISLVIHQRCIYYLVLVTSTSLVYVIIGAFTSTLLQFPRLLSILEVFILSLPRRYLRYHMHEVSSYSGKERNMKIIKLRHLLSFYLHSLVLC